MSAGRIPWWRPPTRSPGPLQRPKMLSDEAMPYPPILQAGERRSCSAPGASARPGPGQTPDSPVGERGPGGLRWSFPDPRVTLQSMSGASSRNYNVILEPSPEGGYVAVVPALPGCYSQGDTVEEALKGAREAIELTLEDMEARGEPIPDAAGELVANVAVG